MKPRSILLLALLSTILVGINAISVTADRNQVAHGQAATYQYYFPIISKQQAACSAVPLPPVDWDPRLGPGGLPLLENVRIIPAQVAACQQYWRVVFVKFQNINESGNDHTIYVKVLDENGNRTEGEKLHLTSWGGLSEYPNEKPAGDLCNCNFDYPMYGDAYSIHIDGALPSDTMADMIMPMNRHVNYRITFQRARNPS